MTKMSNQNTKNLQAQKMDWLPPYFLRKLIHFAEDKRPFTSDQESHHWLHSDKLLSIGSTLRVQIGHHS